jgi:hypothetical protein
LAIVSRFPLGIPQPDAGKSSTKPLRAVDVNYLDDRHPYTGFLVIQSRICYLRQALRFDERMMSGAMG